jgi:hypothetical protein
MNHLMVAEKLSKYRSDARFMAGLRSLRIVEEAKNSGRVKDYVVRYCSDDPQVVDKIEVNIKRD